MKENREDSFRTALLAGAFIAWVLAVSVTAGVYFEALDVLKGWGLIANMALALAVTVTVVWAQFRIRRVIIEAFTIGMEAQQKLDAEKRKEGEHHRNNC